MPLYRTQSPYGSAVGAMGQASNTMSSQMKKTEVKTAGSSPVDNMMQGIGGLLTLKQGAGAAVDGYDWLMEKFSTPTNAAEVPQNAAAQEGTVQSGNNMAQNTALQAGNDMVPQAATSNMVQGLGPASEVAGTGIDGAVGQSSQAAASGATSGLASGLASGLGGVAGGMGGRALGEAIGGETGADIGGVAGGAAGAYLGGLAMSAATGVAGGAAAGATAGSVVPGWGTAIGAVVGALSSFLM